VSVEAISWALNLAPVPVDRGGQASSACKFVLVGLANHAGPDGAGAFPSVATLVRYTGLSERTVRTCLDRLAASSIIRACDPDIVAARIKRADRRPQGWDLNLGLVRDDLAEADIVVLERQFPGLATRLPAPARPVSGDGRNGVQSLHPALDTGEPVDNLPAGVQPLHPAPGPGCNQGGDGVQLTQPRGAAVAPEPSKEPSVEPPAAPERVREATVVVGQGGGSIGEFFAALGDAWILTPAQRARLVPAVEAGLSSGWSPAELAAFTGANMSGVRNPFAVLAARLSPAELPDRPQPSPPRPPWCGNCDERTRRREDGTGADAGRCPACHPLAGKEEPTEPVSRSAASGPPIAVLPGARSGDDLAMHAPRRGKTRHGPGGHDSVGTSAYDRTRTWLPEG
jgi:hypothetical protein